MRENIVELAFHAGILLIYGIAAIVTTSVGIAIEYIGYAHLITGEYQTAAYFGILGLVFLGFAYLIVSNELIPAIKPA